MKSIRRSLGLAAVLLTLGLFAACGGMTPKAEQPTGGAAEPTADQAGQDEREPATLAEAEQLLEKARGDLDRLALNEPGQPAPVAAAPPAAAGAAAPSTVPMPAPRPEAQRADKSAADSSSMSEGRAEEAPRAKEVSACDTACKAFSSLSRASDAVCRLDTDGGQRCERAKKIREDASRRVASCGCAQ
jgi:hypothetical protein